MKFVGVHPKLAIVAWVFPRFGAVVALGGSGLAGAQAGGEVQGASLLVGSAHMPRRDARNPHVNAGVKTRSFFAH